MVSSPSVLPQKAEGAQWSNRGRTFSHTRGSAVPTPAPHPLFGRNGSGRGPGADRTRASRYNQRDERKANAARAQAVPFLPGGGGDEQRERPHALPHLPAALAAGRRPLPLSLVHGCAER
eukprot:gene15466-biopygen15736